MLETREWQEDLTKAEHRTLLECVSLNDFKSYLTIFIYEHAFYTTELELHSLLIAASLPYGRDSLYPVKSPSHGICLSNCMRSDRLKSHLFKFRITITSAPEFPWICKDYFPPTWAGA